VCESGLVWLDPPDNRVPEFVASDPKRWDIGNRLVGVDTALGLSSSVYLGFTLQGYKTIDRRSLTIIKVGLTTGYPMFIYGTFWINIVTCLILFAQHACLVQVLT
jgi:hypothetical protein